MNYDLISSMIRFTPSLSSTTPSAMNAPVARSISPLISCANFGRFVGLTNSQSVFRPLTAQNRLALPWTFCTLPCKAVSLFLSVSNDRNVFSEGRFAGSYGIVLG